MSDFRSNKFDELLARPVQDLPDPPRVDGLVELC